MFNQVFCKMFNYLTDNGGNNSLHPISLTSQYPLFLLIL